MEFISDNVSIDKDEERLSVVISQTLPTGWKRTLFLIWFVFWSLCGVFLIIGLVSEQQRENKLFIAVMLAFWLYYAWRIGKALRWRMRGMEQWLVKGDKLTIKNSISGYGKAKSYFLENISDFKALEIDESSWQWQMSNSIWQIGGERIAFHYNGKLISIGKGLSKKSANDLVKQVSSRLAKARKEQS